MRVLLGREVGMDGGCVVAVSRLVRSVGILIRGDCSKSSSIGGLLVCMHACMYILSLHSSL